MNQFTTISALFNQLISQQELDQFLQKHGYEEVSRKFSVRDLIDFLLAAALEKWDGYRDGADQMAASHLSPVHYSTISKKAAALPYEVIKELFHLLVARCNRAQRRSKPVKHALLLVDSTTMTVGETRLPWAPYHGKRSGIKLHVSYTPETGMPLEVKETIGRVHDGPAGVSLANSSFILVADRAYGKHAQLDAYERDQQRFVIRLKENIEFHRPHGLQRFAPPNTNVTGDITCQLGTEQSRTAHRFRVVTFCDRKGHPMHVATNMRNLSAEAIASMYQARWQIESFFQWIKGQLNVPILFGTSKNAVFSQLFMALIAYILVKWMFESIKEKARKPLSQKGFLRMFLKNTLPVEWKIILASWLHTRRRKGSLEHLNSG